MTQPSKTGCIKHSVANSVVFGVDGDQVVAISAFHTDPLLGLPITDGSDTELILVTDDDGPSLSLSVNVEVVAEDASNPATLGTVTKVLNVAKDALTHVLRYPSTLVASLKCSQNQEVNDGKQGKTRTCRN
ncbi:MAG: hypothetical protein ABGX16_06615, partial [Pirellulales bacterium]